MLVLPGFVTSELVVYAGINTGIRADNFQPIVFGVVMFSLFVQVPTMSMLVNKLLIN